MDNIYINEIENRIIEYLYQVSFPFTDIVINQLSLSKKEANMVSPFTFELSFIVDPTADKLPLYLPTAPITAVFERDDVSILCTLFVWDGNIEIIEIMDMGFKNLDWNCFWNTMPYIDDDYDFDKICSYMTSAPITITKSQIVASSLFLEFNRYDKRYVVQLLDAQVNCLDILPYPYDCQLYVSKNTCTGRALRISSHDALFSIDCMLLRHNDSCLLN